MLALSGNPVSLGSVSVKSDFYDVGKTVDNRIHYLFPEENANYKASEFF
jgi:hypothetical protein